MPIPFHDSEDVEELGTAAFLHVESPTPGSVQRFGALLFINARGEPQEFVFNRVELISSGLWRPSDRILAAVRRLSTSLFHAATLSPRLLFCRAEAISPYLFGPGGQVELSIPVGRIAGAEEAVSYLPAEGQETIETADGAGELLQTHLFWTPGPPDGASQELFSRLAWRGLILEPFERAGRGLREVYGDPLGSAR